MNLDILQKSGRIHFSAIVGSKAYGTDTPTSDTDIRGLFIVPTRERISIKDTVSEIGNDKQDIKYYELAKYFRLAADCNPNIIEMLWSPPECVQVMTDRIKPLFENRKLFISKKAYHTFSGYSFAQIKKAKGQNKWINNPMPETPPDRSTFCHFIPSTTIANDAPSWMHDLLIWLDDKPPSRPIPINDLKSLDLSKCHAAEQERVPNTYRLYWYGSKAKGVFRNSNIVVESIPLEDEQSKFIGLLTYNDQQYNQAMKDWTNYWTWVKERNPERWKLQEAGSTDYDVKNMMHCCRLLMSGINILENGEPIVKFTGDNLAFLRKIREGGFKYEEIMEFVYSKMETLDKLNETSTLQWGVDLDKIDDLFKDIAFRDLCAVG